MAYSCSRALLFIINTIGPISGVEIFEYLYVIKRVTNRPAVVFKSYNRTVRILGDTRNFVFVYE